MEWRNAAAGSAWSGGAVEDDTFAAFLELLRKYPNSSPRVVIHPSLLTPALCRHCGRRDDVTPAETDAEHAPAEAVAVHPYELAMGRRTCLRCVKAIYEMMRRLQDATMAGSGGDTPLHHAARSGNLRVLCHLATLVGKEDGGHEKVVQLLRRANDRGETALHLAVSVGYRHMVELMLWIDPQLGWIPCGDTSPMYLAVSQGRKDIARALHYGAPPGPDADLSYSGPSEQNALHAAVLQGPAMTKMLLAWNKDLSKRKDENGSTPLHFAVSVEQHQRVRILGATYTWSREVPTGQLLDADASIAYEQDGQGSFPVHVAAMTNQRVAVSILLRRCPSCMNLRDNQGRTFLHVAVKNNALSVVRLACTRSEFAPVMNIQDMDGNTALHLAVDVENLGMVCAVLGNQEVCLNLRNSEGRTALDIAKSKIRQGFFFSGNPDKVVYNILMDVGAKHGNSWQDHIKKNRIPDSMNKLVDSEKEAPEDLMNKESEKLTSSTQTLGIGAVLIATVAFGATFTLPGGNIADDHPHGGSPTLSGRWYFDAFMVANTLAFICASVATVGLMYSGTAMVTLRFRRVHFNISLLFVSSSVTSLTAAFALGVYMVLAPVARPTAIAICAISPLVLLYKNVQGLWRITLVSGPLRARKGFRVSLMLAARAIMIIALSELWPFALIFGWAAHLRDRRHG